MPELLINIGCGQVAHPEWLNFDSHPVGRHIRRRDLRRGLPCEAGSAAMCYSSHVLEHLTPREAIKFLREQFRVLKSAGIIRVVVPDLEAICRNLLQFIDESHRGIPGAPDRLQYSYLELFDQAVRTESGGELLTMWRNCPLGLEEFVRSRSGEIFRLPGQAYEAPAQSALALRLAAVWRRARQAALAGCGFILFGKSGWQAVGEGLFRQRGEIHRAMYDEVRLKSLLAATGFHDARRLGVSESGLPAFSLYELDAMNDHPRKPDSMYLEAYK